MYTAHACIHADGIQGMYWYYCLPAMSSCLPFKQSVLNSFLYESNLHNFPPDKPERYPFCVNISMSTSNVDESEFFVFVPFCLQILCSRPPISSNKSNKTLMYFSSSMKCHVHF